MKKVFAPHLGRHVILGGKKRRTIFGPQLRLSRYLKAGLPAPPTSCDYSPLATTALSQMYDNDQLGDCVIAAGYHIVGTESGNANGGKPFIATDKQIIADYSAIGGYVPGNPNTDQGCDIQTALNYWVSHGFADGTKPLGWLAVDAGNPEEVKQAIYLFGGSLDIGVELPDAWINPFPSSNGFIWDVAGDPDQENGHSIMSPGFNAVGYTKQGIIIATWSLLGVITWAAVQKYLVNAAGGELYVLLMPDQIAAGQAKAPNGVAWADLIADWDALGGTIPIPSPTPPPPPPSPVAGVTLAQCDAAIDAAFAKAPFFLWPRSADKIAKNALASLPWSTKP